MIYDSIPPEVLLLGASCDSLLLGEVLTLCFLFLVPSPLAGLPPLGLVLLRGPELMVPRVALPVCSARQNQDNVPPRGSLVQYTSAYSLPM